MFENVKNAIQAIKNGKMIIITDDEHRENEGDVVFAARFANEENVNFCLKYGSGVVCAAISKEIADKFALNPMEKENTDPFYTAFYSSLDADPKYGITTGISASDRAITIKMLTGDFSSKDFRKPGHVFPIVAKEFGILERMGHTEAAVEMASLAGFEKAAVICELMDENGRMLRGKSLFDFAKSHGILVISTADIKRYKIANFPFLIRTASTNLPTDFGIMQMHVYQNPVSKIEHIVMMSNGENRFGDVQKPLIRIHSECITSEVFFSQKCDCKQQLANSMRKVQEIGCGAVIYMRGHEGRGIGITKKIQAYSLQEQGLNTIEANEKLNLPVDARDFTDAASILRDLNVKSLDLYTGNPKKGAFLSNYGFNFTTISPQVELNEHNTKYLHDKIDKLGHSLVFTNE